MSCYNKYVIKCNKFVIINKGFVTEQAERTQKNEG